MDKKTVKILDKKLLIMDKSISFQYKIADVIVLEDKVIVMLEIPTNENFLENIYAVSPYCEIIWQVQPIKDFDSKILEVLPYENLFYNNEKLSASDFYGRKYDIDVENGKIKSFQVSK